MRPDHFGRFSLTASLKTAVSEQLRQHQEHLDAAHLHARAALLVAGWTDNDEGVWIDPQSATGEIHTLSKALSILQKRLKPV